MKTGCYLYRIQRQHRDRYFPVLRKYIADAMRMICFKIMIINKYMTMIVDVW